METSKFIRVNTEQGVVLISANNINSIGRSSYTDATYRPGLNQTGNIVLLPEPRAFGVNTAIATDKLIDSSADFIAAGVQVGDRVENRTGGGNAVVTAIDSATQLSLDANNFGATNQAYEITFDPEENNDLQNNLKDAVLTVLSQKWTDVVIDLEVPEGKTVEYA